MLYSWHKQHFSIHSFNSLQNIEIFYHRVQDNLFLLRALFINVGDVEHIERQ